MDEAPIPPDETENQPIEKGGVIGPFFLTIFTLTIIVGLVLLPFLGDREPLKELLEGSEWWVGNVGEYHPLFLHLPIGIVFLVLVMEICSWLSFGRYRPMTGVALFFAFITGAFACVTGFFDLNVEGMKAESWDDPWFQHMWLGIIFVGILGLAFLAKIWGRRSGARGPIYGFLLMGAAGVMGYGAHIGGVKVHKTDPVINTLEGLELLPRAEEDSDDKVRSDVEAGVDALSGPGGRLAFADVVLPIMESKCLACHSVEAGKDKGDLYMDTYANLLKGGASQDGDDYRTLVPGNAKKSYMIEVMNLPMDDDMHMPPPKKKQMEAYEIELLTWWVDHIPASETLEDQTLSEMGAPQNILDAAAKMLSPDEREAMEKKAEVEKAQIEAEKARIEAEKVAKQEALQKSYQNLKEDESFQTSLSYVSEGSHDLKFSALSLRENLNDEILMKLSPVAESMIELELGGSSVTDSAVTELLSKMPHLVKLNLSQTGLGDDVMDAVSKLEKLEYLNLYGTGVSDAGITKLKTLGNLQKLYLWQSQVTQEGAEQLKNELPGLEFFFGVIN